MTSDNIVEVKKTEDRLKIDFTPIENANIYNLTEWIHIFRINAELANSLMIKSKHQESIARAIEAIKIYNKILAFLLKNHYLNKKDAETFESMFENEDKLSIDTCKINEDLADLAGIKKIKINMGNSLRTIAEEYYAKNDFTTALEYSKQALLMHPKGVFVNFTLAKTLQSLKSNKEAAHAYENVIKYDKNYIEGRRVLGELYMTNEAQNMDKVIENYLIYMEHTKNNISAYINIGLAYSHLGMQEKCEEICHRGQQLEPGNDTLVNVCLLNYLKLQNRSQSQIKEKTIEIAENYIRSRRIERNIYSFKGWDKNKDRKLRIGYVSSDLYHHIVSRFFLPVIGHHDQSKYDIFLYLTQKKDDSVTRKYKEMTPNFFDCSQMERKEFTDKINADKIDILIDLNVYTGNTRIFNMVHKPAPIQCIYLGYPNTSGIKEVDYILTDKDTIKPDEACDYSETPAYIEEGFEIYQPDATGIPEIVTAPFVKNKYITFGVFNATSKVTISMVKTWSTILKNSRNTKILFQYITYYTKNNKERIINEFSKNGISKDRILFHTKDTSSHYNNLQKADIALDTHPYSGTGTTFDCLLMGLPVVCFDGFNATSRPTSRILKAIGASELIAKTEEDYVKIALGLINNTETILNYRKTLRDRLKSSKLLNYAKFTKSLEETYTKMWHKYCDESN